MAKVSATPNGDSNVPEGYSVIYVLTEGDELIIRKVGPEPMFDVMKAGHFRIHTLVYEADSSSFDFLDLSVVEPGTTTGFDVLKLIESTGICADLDAEGAKVSVEEFVCEADAGTLTIDKTPVTLENGLAKVSATPNGDSNVPEGYSVIYVLTEGDELIIRKVGPEPMFDVMKAGHFRIHTLVYEADSSSSDFLDLSVVEPGTTTGFDVLKLIESAGICADLDAEGAKVSVEEFVCEANAGTLTIDKTPVTLESGLAKVSATPNGDSNVPEGYSVIYVLTEGDELIIRKVGPEPMFDVMKAGHFRIHTLVYEADSSSSDFLDLSVVEPGTTTGFDVLKLIESAGICADLDAEGAKVSVEEPVCEADAGTLTIDKTPVTLENGLAKVSATPNGDSNVPEGYSVIYVLTEGDELIIRKVGPEPMFDVMKAGHFRIHTLVYEADSSSSDFLDLSVVEPGTTTGFDVLKLIESAGICADLDAEGAKVSVEEPEPPVCEANAGSLTIDRASTRLSNGMATVSATPNGDINVPDGFSVIFVLTEGDGLIIQKVSPSPMFEVMKAGQFRIHTLVFNADSQSSDFLDLSVVEFGKTTGFDVLNLVESADICADLDATGAKVTVEEAQNAILGDFVFEDRNKNGIQDAGEPGVPGVRVELLSCTFGKLAQVRTNSDGQYLFIELPPGEYYVKFSDIPEGFEFTLQDQGNDDEADSDVRPDPNELVARTQCLTLVAGDNIRSIDAGIIETSPVNIPSAAIGDFVFNDANRNSIQDPGEVGVPDVRVELISCETGKITQVRTDQNGRYAFKGLEAGEYYVKFSDIPEGFEFVKQNQGTDDTVDSDVNPDGNVARTACFLLADGEVNLTIDAGICDIDTKAHASATGISSDISTTGLEISAYPNPFAQSLQVTVYSESSDLVSLRLIDIMGRVIMEQVTEANGETITLQSEGTEGVYILQVIDGTDILENIRLVRVNQ